MKVISAVIELILGLASLSVGYNCDHNYWPNFYNTGTSDTTKCAAQNKGNKLMIIGGVSEEKVAGRNIKTGFAYSLDFDGNWMWSHKFTDGLDSISQIDECTMSEDGALSYLFGLYNE